MSKKIIVSDNEIIEIIKKCEVVNVAFLDKEFPYVIPLNFGLLVDNGTKTLYFHGAKDGGKFRLLKTNNHVSFSMYANTQLVINEIGCKSTMKYESVCGNGLAFVANENEKQRALEIIMKQYSHNKSFTFDKKTTEMVEIWKINILNWTGKRSL